MHATSDLKDAVIHGRVWGSHEWNRSALIAYTVIVTSRWLLKGYVLFSTFIMFAFIFWGKIIPPAWIKWNKK